MLERLEDLMSGDEIPQNEIEELFVRFYTRAVRGHGLLALVIDAKEDVTQFTPDELSIIVLGYALGQKQRMDNKDGIDLNKETDNPLH